MKLFFKNVTVKNFLSFGENVTVFDYKTGMHVVTGSVKPGDKRNGAGKSTILSDSIVFAIYGRTMRKMKKDSIINEKNGNNCVVTCEFDVGPIGYKIERGIKPNCLKLWESKVHDFSGEPIEMDSLKNTQKKIIDIIGIAYESFINLIVLNINHSVPFLEMDPKEKRPVLVDLMNLSVYGKMSEIAKQNHLTANSELKICNSDLKSCIDNLSISKDKRKSLLIEVERFDSEKQDSIDVQRKILNSKIDEKGIIENKITANNYKKQISELSDKKIDIENKIRKIGSNLQDSKRDIKDAQGVLNLLDGTPTCPTCKTKTDNPDIMKYVDESKEKIKESSENIEKLLLKKEKGESVLSKLNKKISDIRSEKSNEDKYCIQLESIKKSIKETEERLIAERSRELDIGNIISDNEIKEKENKKNSMLDDVNKAKSEVLYNKFLRSMLGDDGIGKYVIRKILPFLNKKVNEYLSILGSDYSMIFDADLNEVLKSKNKKEREYSSFSGGEKKRIDLSVLLAMMDVAKSQNSVDTNILILDEVLDTSMDTDGVESFMWHLKDSFTSLYPDKCIYVITHRKEIGEEVFDSIINVVKQDDFTTIH